MTILKIVGIWFLISLLLAPLAGRWIARKIERETEPVDEHWFI